MRRLVGALAAAGAGAVAYGALIERRWYAERHESIPVLRRPGRLRVLFFSDLHFAPGQEHRLDFVRRVAASCAPDLVVSGGDNLEHAEAIGPVVALHREVLEMTGAPGLAVLGSHDRYAPSPFNPARYLMGPSKPAMLKNPQFDTAALIEGLQEGGWHVLNNASSVVETKVGPVEATGVDDPHIDRHDLSVIQRGADDRPVLRLGLLHAPYARVLQAYDDHDYDLALAGHTHGGQLALPFYGALVTNCDLPPALAKGTARVGAHLDLHVSAGMGHSIYAPIRFACRPELSILDLVGRQA